jgi:ABC-type uncharacterized transport system auxiliary subunit
MGRATQLILAAGVIVAVGCGSPRPISYYAIQIPAAPAPATHRYPIDLAVGRVTGSDLLEASPIVYKTSRNQIATYQYHRWSEAPVNMVQSKLARLLRTSGDYQSINGSAGAAGGEFVVRGRLYELEEVDGDTISGLVSMEFELYNRKTGRIVWSQFYSRNEPVAGKQVPAVVQALDRNLDRGLNEVVAGLGHYFAANPPEKAAAPAPGSATEARIK